jgi:DNA-binding transcriptional ArsR family regulator
MSTIKNFDYKGFACTLDMGEHMGITFSASSFSFRSKHRKEHINGGYEKPDEAINNLKQVIDEFLANTPKNYEELAQAIENNVLIWTDYENCHLEPKLLEIIIKNFLLTQPTNSLHLTATNQ